eukprot:938706-Ditylum_brightwellii.AAC.1
MRGGQCLPVGRYLLYLCTNGQLQLQQTEQMESLDEAWKHHEVLDEKPGQCKRHSIVSGNAI